MLLELLLAEPELLLTELEEREVEEERLTLEDVPEEVVVLILVRAEPELLTLLLTVVCDRLDDEDDDDDDDDVVAGLVDLLPLTLEELLPLFSVVPELEPLEPETELELLESEAVLEPETEREAARDVLPEALLVTDAASTASLISRAFTTLWAGSPETLRAGVLALRSTNERSGCFTP